MEVSTLSPADAVVNGEAQPLLQHHGSHQQRRKHLSLHTAYRFPKISEKAAIFMLVWNIIFTISLSSCIRGLLLDNGPILELPSLSILCPVVGLLSDCWIGRFKIIKAANYFLLVAIVFKSATILTSSPVAVYLVVAVWTPAIACYFTCIIQFTTDQMIGASGEELSFVIYWLLWGFTTGDLISRTIGCVLNLYDQQFLVVTFTVATTSFIICFIMMENCSHVLMTKPQISNPIKQIVLVLNYARKHKIPERRSALTYWEEDYPSRIDLGKNRYGGPFTVEEVEDVKTTFRLIPVIVCITMFLLGCGHMDYHYIQESSTKCYNEANISGGIVAYLVAALGLPAYHFIIYPFFYNHIPSMLKRIGLGMIITGFSFLCNSIIEVVGHMEDRNVTCMFSVSAEEGSHFPIDYWWALIPNLIHGMGFTMVMYSTFEFVIAQTPCQIKGLIVSILLELIGIFFVTIEFVEKIFTAFPFQTSPSCGFYYYMTLFVIMLAILFLFVLISKWYRLRKRDDFVPYHVIAENYFEKNYHRENQYMKRYDCISTTS